MPQPILPTHRELYYGGAWHAPKTGATRTCQSPATGDVYGSVSVGGADDMAAAIAAAKAAFPGWRDTHPAERARRLRLIAAALRDNKKDLALLDAAESGNPVSAMLKDVDIAVDTLEFFAGLVTEMKGDTIPMGPNVLNFTAREPLGVVGRIVAYNHPLMFCGSKMAAPLAAGNTLIVKPAEQAPLSVLRFIELIEGILPAGVFNVVNGGVEAGKTLAGHPDVAMIALIGSVPTGRAVMAEAARTVKPVMLELGGKNAVIVCPDADLDKAAQGIITGMNFAWCGQSCGSTSRAFIHEDVHEAVLERVAEKAKAFVPGDPTLPDTTMGALISRAQYDKVLRYIGLGRSEGARVVTGGEPSSPDGNSGFFIRPTIFADVTPNMTVAREEIFGPVLCVLRWADEADMLAAVNGVEYGLTCSIWTQELARAHRLARGVDAGFVWVNKSAAHFLGAPFGGVKQSGIGREESLGELLSFTREKNVHIALD